ncbi:uncharacterized protein TRAVEDRAFT_60366 [Trametes versicolor FP-101664 SS1]|uniref:uncharacterized protein n=1 Tax=Trametes versicolor (strain FP-101664) TaxID=717944 RepID=UPI0004621E83|nr:uncharacterized protein TRAVEDRAFT_60366 [Trametes versicolor FP-101664 SS1]EIW55074.1 hypothetical protein TRAVEDRAFT_60366 [Trametes versicolor FP-101664 SS1]
MSRVRQMCAAALRLRLRRRRELAAPLAFALPPADVVMRPAAGISGAVGGRGLVPTSRRRRRRQQRAGSRSSRPASTVQGKSDRATRINSCKTGVRAGGGGGSREAATAPGSGLAGPWV